MNFYNKKHLVRIEIQREKVDFICVWKEEKRFFGIRTQKRGVYTRYFSSFISECVPCDKMLIDGVLYIKARVIRHYTGGHSKVAYFDDYEEAKNYARNWRESVPTMTT